MLAGAHSSAGEDNCCSDGTSGSLSARGLACPVLTGPISDSADNVVASAAEGGCCDCSPKRLSSRGQACPIPDNEDNVVAPDADGDCCSDCAPECLSVRGQVYPVGIQPISENKDNVVTPTVNARASINVALRVSRQYVPMPNRRQF